MIGIKKKSFDEDEPIVQACQKGDVEAFEVLVTKHQKRMFNIAYRMIGDIEDAGEVVQDAFVAAYRNIKRFEGQSKFTTWLTRIVINKSKNRMARLRSKKRVDTVSLDGCLQTEDSQVRLDPTSNDLSPLANLERKQMQQLVQRCIGTIAEGFREVLVLRDIQGYSLTEVGTMLEIPEGTVKSKLFRARDFLKACLKKIFGDLVHVLS